jgi:hypothetical protein
MSPFDIYIFDVSWRDGSKRRPVLVYALDNEIVRIYPITSQYESKSEAVRAKYFKIIDWRQSGLDKQSYVDTGTRFKQQLSVFRNMAPIGQLTDEDKLRLIEFLKQS